ncbi:MAG: efflux RND transporter periplasmic adaptor subunit [Candidatus Margulisiibacteriota bacterium]|nr:efflux RND transporter periplasmic adaptor subunit [Candidatus Margulisiibacteriota bacterium]
MRKFLFLLLLIPLIAVSCAKKEEAPLKMVKVTRGSIKAQIATTGIVEPRNRLEIKPPVAGRIDKVLVKEGQTVRKGQVLAEMSSSDRAALLDAARSKGAAELKRWEDVYKPAPIIAPLNGFIIQRAVEPGQTVTVSDPVLVMADKLIVKGEVDETDIGLIRVGQVVNIELDAYPGKNIKGEVEHIAFESTTVNNVNVYKVDILPDKVPSFFRAGMSATVNFVLREKNGIMLLPLNVVKKIGNKSYVFILPKDSKKTKDVQVKLGLENDIHVEVVSGLSEGDEVLVPTAKMVQDLRSKFERRRGPTNPLQKKN